MKVLVFGCGPAGLMAAHAVNMATEGMGEVHIASKKRKSTMYGAQYLHRPIPGITNSEDFVVLNYWLRGEIRDYRRKVYGPMWDGQVSPDTLPRVHRAWNISTTYDKLWARYEDHIHDMTLRPSDVREAIDVGGYDLILNTIPLKVLCPEGHTFQSRFIKAAGSAPDLGIDIPYNDCEPNSVLCNGNEVPTWYRMSNVFGMKTVEWPDTVNPPLSHSRVEKPIKHNCTCWPEVKMLGRYGSWTKGVLSHQAYFDTYNLITTAVRS